MPHIKNSLKKVAATLHKKALVCGTPKMAFENCHPSGKRFGTSIFFKDLFFSRALVDTLYSKRMYDGSKIARETDFEYTSLEDENKRY